MNNYFFNYVSEFIPEENILREEEMKKHTTFKIGGAAEVFIKIQTTEQLSKLILLLKKLEIPYFILGNGSNLLVSDSGYRGVIIQIDSTMSNISVQGNQIVAQAGASLAAVAQSAYQAGLKGMEFAAGIPGSVGGAIVMNAGAYGGEMSQVVKSVHVMDTEGNVLLVENDYLKFGYRKSIIKNNTLIALDVTFHLEAGNQEEIRSKMQEFAVLRKEKQPLELPSAGSTFKRPEGHFAGKLIMESGLSGYRIGDAMVSPKHNGFIVNMGEATAGDVKALITYIVDQVECKSGIILEPEIVFLGKF